MTVMAGHSRPKDGVASARLRPAIHVLLESRAKYVDARDKPGYDEGHGWESRLTRDLEDLEKELRIP
jgi:hypothetical protein